MQHLTGTAMGLAAALIFVGCAGPDAERTGQREPAGRIAAIVTPALTGCPDRIWPGYRWDGFQAMMVDNEGQRAFVWNRSGAGDLQPVGYGELPEGFRQEGWHLGSWQGRPALSISLSDFGGDPETLAYLIIHEGFHHLVQSRWRNPYESLRGSTYPEEWRSRYLRRRIMASLLEAFAGRTEALGHAAWWQQRYAREFPDDARENRDSDVVEGTAEFAGLLGVELGRLGCSASDGQLLEGLRPWVRDLWDKRWNNLDYELTVRDVEPYAIGSLAGLILDSRGVDWWARAAAGETPMEILAGEASPLADHDDAALAARVKEHYTRRNEEFGAVVQAYLAAESAPESLRLAIPLSWAVGATLEGKGFVNFRGKAGFRKLLIAANGQFAGKDGVSRIEIRDALAELTKGSGVHPFGHGEGALVTLLPAEALHASDDGSFAILSETVRATALRIEIVTDDDGGRWIGLH